MKTIKINHDIILLYMPAGGQMGMIQAWFQGDHSWVEFRGPKFNDWDPDVAASPFQIIHDSLLGMHCTVLHQDSILALTRDRHSDFPAIEKLMRSKNPIFVPPEDFIL